MIPPVPRKHVEEPPAIVRVLKRGDVLWGRPVFKAPPLRVEVPTREIQNYFADETVSGMPSR